MVSILHEATWAFDSRDTGSRVISFSLTIVNIMIIKAKMWMVDIIVVFDRAPWKSRGMNI